MFVVLYVLCVVVMWYVSAEVVMVMVCAVCARDEAGSRGVGAGDGLFWGTC